MNKRVVSKKRKDNVLLAIKARKLSRSGLITEWVNDKFISDLDKKFNFTRFPLKSAEELDELKARELADLSVTQRGVQTILSKLLADGLVSRNKYYEYSLIDNSPLAKLGELIRARRQEIVEEQMKVQRDPITIVPLTNGGWAAASRRLGVIFDSPSPSVSCCN